ncbi:MAG: transposase [Thermocrispum sp.]
MSNSSRRLSCGDRRRNDRLAALRAVITRHSAVLAFDLAADKQVCALTDQDSRVLARRTVKAKAWQLREAVEWGMTQAVAAGFSSVVVACEPTGHRWRVLDQIAAEAGARLVCVQPLLVHRARESEDFTHNKSDETDAMIIARLVTELRCYLPERAEPVWARLRHLGARRVALVTDATAARQQITDLLECAWPAALQAAAKPMKSTSWLAAMTVLLDRVGASGDLTVIRRWGWSRFAAAVRRELPRPRRHPLALDDRAGRLRRRRRPGTGRGRGVQPARGGTGADPVRAGRPGPRPRRNGPGRDRMLKVLDELGSTMLVTSIPGLSAVGGAAILAETGDPTRFSSARALVKHAGLCPRDNASGTYQGKTGISGRGRPHLRLAAWRAVWPALRSNPVLAARHAHLIGRADNKLTSPQARVAVAGSLLRQLHAVITTDTAWDSAIASGLNPQSPASARGAAAAA